jgi:hypothetical protein
MEATKYNKFEVEVLLKLSGDQEFKLERAFDVYKKSGAKHYYYNLLNTVKFPERINKSLYTIYNTNAQEPWTVISYRHYGRIDLWWLIACINKISDTFTPLPAGTKLMIPTGPAVRTIIDEIKTKL